jgi:hypothetical protein
MLPPTVAQPEIYELTITADRQYTTDRPFAGHAAAPSGKIYMLTAPQADATVHYVGRTIDPMRKRLGAHTLSPNYQWATQPNDYRLFVWGFEDYAGESGILESIEAELVFCIRVAQKAWPKWQTRIHFRHLVDRLGLQTTPQLAIQMLRQYYDATRPTNLATRAALQSEANSALRLLPTLILGSNNP